MNFNNILSHEIFYNSIFHQSYDEFDKFLKLFFSSNTIINDKFKKLISPNNQKEIKDESSINYMNKLFSDIFSIFPQNYNHINYYGDLDIPSFLLKKKKKTKLETHNRLSEDNMIRKIKYKVFESMYKLVNEVLKKEDKNKKIFRIKGIYTQELNINFNLWLILQKIKDIFCLNISLYYSKGKNSNYEIINTIINSGNEEYINTKRVLNMPFHEFYHKIFLNEDENFVKNFGIQMNNKYIFEYYINKVKSKSKKSINNENDDNIYKESVVKLAKNYEDYFLKKNKRKSKKAKKKLEDECIESIIKKIDYDFLKNEVIKIKELYKKLEYNSKFE